MAGEKIVQQALKAVRELNPLGLFSRATEEAARIPQAKGTPQQMRAALLKQGVKPDELKWTGFDDWSKGRQSVTRDEVAEFLRQNQVQVNEARLANTTAYPYQTGEEWQRAISRAERRGDYDEAERLNQAWEAFKGLGPESAPKFEKYTLPGGENYREVLLTGPMREGSAGYRSSHWDEPNVLAHLRLKDRTDPDGRRVLHLEEIQSDWAQEGRKKGFQKPLTIDDLVEARPYGYPEDVAQKVAQNWYVGERGALPIQAFSREKYPTFDDARRAYLEVNKLSASGTPLAPFVESTPKWTDLALKRALREAVEGNYDALAWTPGATQAARYPGGREGMEAGMIGYYDKIVPNQLQKLVRPMDPNAQFGTVNIATPVRDARTTRLTDSELMAELSSDAPPPQSMQLPSLNITPAMREKIKEGLPLFTMVPGAVGLGMAQPEAAEEPREGYDKGGVIARAIKAARETLSPEELLMGIHNTGAGRKLEMIEKLGGLPAPSIAVTKPSHGYTAFGDVSLVAPVEMVTPGRKTPAFGSDVYSPRFPSVEDDQIFRGFTPSGKRRYAPLTMENVLREMKGPIRGGESWNYGPASVRAQVTPQFGSLPEMQAARDKIVSPSEFEAYKDASNEMMERLRERFEPYFKPADSYRHSWSAFPEALTDFARTGRPSEFAYDYKDLPAEALTEARSFLGHLRDMPTEYFEVKPQRAVPLSEFAGAVVPGDVPGEVVDRLRRLGVGRIEEYGDDASRRDALMKFVGEQGFAGGGEVRDEYAGGGKAKSVIDQALAAIRKARPEQMRRAREQGFDTTKMYLHGTQTSPEEILPNFYISRDPNIADVYARRGEHLLPDGQIPEGAAVMPVLVKKGAAIPGRPGTGYMVVREPSEVRSVFADFDPAKKDSGNIMSSIAVPAALGAGYMADDGREDRASGGRLLKDEYPTHYLPNVGRQVMADGGSPSADDAYLDALLEASRPDADIRRYESRMADIARQPEDIRSMTHAPSKPLRPVEIEGGLIGKRTLGEVPYDVAGPLSGTAQLAYSLKTLPFYFTPAAPIAAAADLGEAAIDTAQAAQKGDYLGAGITGALGVAMPGYAYRNQIGDVVGRALNAVRGNPGAVGAGVAGAAMVAPEDAEAGKARMMQQAIASARAIARAKELGYDTSKVWYHSALNPIEKFEPHGKFMGRSGVSGIHLTDNPEMANRFLERFGDYDYKNQPFQKNVMPVFVRAKSVLERDEPFKGQLSMGQPVPEDYQSPLLRMGYDALLRNEAINRRGAVKHVSPGTRGSIEGKELILTDPSQVRSIYDEYAAGGSVSDRAVELAKELGSSPREPVKS